MLNLGFHQQGHCGSHVASAHGFGYWEDMLENWADNQNRKISSNTKYMIFMLFVQVDEWIVDVKIDDGGREGRLHHR